MHKVDETVEEMKGRVKKTYSDGFAQWYEYNKMWDCENSAEPKRYSFTIYDIVFYIWSILALGALCHMVFLRIISNMRVY